VTEERRACGEKGCVEGVKKGGWKGSEERKEEREISRIEFRQLVILLSKDLDSFDSGPL